MTPVATSEAVCLACGTPLGADGVVDASRLSEAAADRSHTRAMREDRAQVEMRLEQARSAEEKARRHKDTLAGIAASQRVEELEERLAHIDGLLGEAAETPPPMEGACETCGTPFRGGRPDLEAVRELLSARAQQESQLDALERELASVHVQIATDRVHAEEAEQRAQSGRRVEAETSAALGHRLRVEHNEARVAEIEAAIVRVRSDLDRDTPAARAPIRAFVTGRKRPPRGEMR
jgi:hypothetical protein